MDVGESSDIQEGNGGGIPEFRESSGPTHNLAGAEPVAFFSTTCEQKNWIRPS